MLKSKEKRKNSVKRQRKYQNWTDMTKILELSYKELNYSKYVNNSTRKIGNMQNQMDYVSRKIETQIIKRK